jgi:poly(3-hydroxybutyrate) depolymerase
MRQREPHFGQRIRINSGNALCELIVDFAFFMSRKCFLTYVRSETASIIPSNLHWLFVHFRRCFPMSVAPAAKSARAGRGSVHECVPSPPLQKERWRRQIPCIVRRRRENSDAGSHIPQIIRDLFLVESLENTGFLRGNIRGRRSSGARHYERDQIMRPVHWRTSSCRFVAALIACVAGHAAAQSPAGLSVEDRAVIDSAVGQLETTIRNLGDRARQTRKSSEPDDIADAAAFHKAVVWALRYEPELKPADVALINKALARGKQRVEQLQAGRHDWSSKRGKLVRGYISSVDDSVQPYGVVVPIGYDPQQPMRLDVVLHGSTRPVGLAELRFMNRFDEEDTDSSKAPDQPFIELHPSGRVENCYRWAGETDVFEAIEDVCRKYNIDRDRIVLRGMSMGASGTWHLGLKHPDRFVALGPYCGYVDTHRFSETPLPNFVKVGPLPDHQELGLHMLDSVDYAANAGVVPAIACMGEKDVFFQAHVIMGEAMRREGLEMVNPIDPVTHAEQMRRIGAYAKTGIDHAPKQLRFVTWTLKYNRCHWLQILGLEHHYARAEIAARIRDDGAIEVDEPKNITRFAIDESVFGRAKRRSIRIAGREVAYDNHAPSAFVHFEKRAAGWQNVPAGEFESRTVKRPGLQGPIDDAFTTRFVCVRGTGQPWNAAAQAYAEASLKRFAYEWSRYFRGDLPIKDDTQVTAEDLRSSNLILFGDPGSNEWICKALPDLPITWSKDTLHMAGKDYSAAEHVPALIHPNPLPGAEGRYIVLNSGHTFRESELNLLNYLLFPRWGDWAVLKVGGKAPVQPGNTLDEEVISAGYFDERWKINE